jgi:hypothetical protein
MMAADFETRYDVWEFSHPPEYVNKPVYEWPHDWLAWKPILTNLRLVEAHRFVKGSERHLQIEESIGTFVSSPLAVLFFTSPSKEEIIKIDNGGFIVKWIPEKMTKSKQAIDEYEDEIEDILWNYNNLIEAARVDYCPYMEVDSEGNVMKDYSKREDRETWFPSSFKKLQKCIEERPLQRAKARTAAFKEELMRVCWHPQRVERLLEAGMAIEDL